MVDAELIKPIVEFLIKKRKNGKNRPNNFSGEITFLFSEIRGAVPGLSKINQLKKLFYYLKQKDCWVERSCEGAIHNFNITTQTTEASATITVDCTTDFLQVKLRQLAGQIDEESESNKTVLIISNYGIKLQKDKIKIYTIAGKRKDLVDFLLSKNDEPISGNVLKNKLEYLSISQLSDEISQINKVFKKNFNLEIELIINKPRGSGYRLNNEKFIIRKK